MASVAEGSLRKIITDVGPQKQKHKEAGDGGHGYKEIAKGLQGDPIPKVIC